MNINLHRKLIKLEANYFDGDKKPFIVIATCNDGFRYEVNAGHVMQCRIARWTPSNYRYSENGIGFLKSEWTGKPINIVVNDDNRLGA